jgi:hypothetical protein
MFLLLYPSRNETIVTPLPAEEVAQRFARATNTQLPADREHLFSGWVKENRFLISLRVTRPNNYLPRVSGQIESTSSGCILFMRSELFPTTKMFVAFWFLFILLAGLVIGFQSKNWFYLLGGFALIGFIYWVVWSNFSIQYRVTQKAIEQTLN